MQTRYFSKEWKHQQVVFTFMEHHVCLHLENHFAWPSWNNKVNVLVCDTRNFFIENYSVTSILYLYHFDFDKLSAHELRVRLSGFLDSFSLDIWWASHYFMRILRIKLEYNCILSSLACLACCEFPISALQLLNCTWPPRRIQSKRIN